MSLRVVSGHYGVPTLAVAALAEHDSTRTCSQDPRTAGSSRIQGIVTKFLGRWGRDTGSRYVVRYSREIFTLRVENELVNPGRGRRTRVEDRRWWTCFMWLWSKDSGAYCLLQQLHLKITPQWRPLNHSHIKQVHHLRSSTRVCRPRPGFTSSFSTRSVKISRE
jgi:hypothetical protein